MYYKILYILLYVEKELVIVWQIVLANATKHTKESKRVLQSHKAFINCKKEAVNVFCGDNFNALI